MNRNCFLILCTLILSVIGCTKPDDGKYEISFAEKTFKTGAGESQLYVPFRLTPSTDKAVSASVDADWLTVDGVNGKEVVLRVSENITGEDRTAMLTLSLKGAPDASVRILQSNKISGKVEVASVTNILEATGGDYILPYSIEGAGKDYVRRLAVNVEEGCNWLTVKEKSNTEIVFHAEANSFDERTAEVTLAYTGLDETKVIFVQKPAAVTSTIKLASASVAENCTAHTFDLSYSISGASAGSCAKAELSEQVSWVRITGVTESKISFELDANTADANRSVGIVLTVAGARPVTLTLVQKADSPFDISVNNVTSAAASVTIKPVSETVTYAYSVEKKSLFEGYGSEDYIANYIEELLSMAKENQVAFGDLLAKGPVSFKVDKLKDNEDYYALAFDIDATGKSSGKVTLLEFKTAKVIPSNNTFTFTVSDKGVITVKPTQPDDPYVFFVWDIGTWQDFATPLKGAERLVEYMKEFDGALETYTHRGTYTEDYANYLENGQNVAFAFGYKDGITTDVYYTVFDWKK